MSKPPDKICINLVPNPDDDDNRSSNAEEIRRLRAIIALNFLEAEKAGIEVHATGEIDPIAQENPDRFEKIRDASEKKLVYFSRTYREAKETHETINADGSSSKRVTEMKEVVTRLGSDFELLSALADLVKAISGGVVKIGGKICSAVLAKLGGDNEDDSDSSSSSSSD